MEDVVHVLTKEELQTFQEDGVLVVDNFLSEEEIAEASHGFSQTLARFGVDTDDLEETGQHIRSLSSTNGSGGVLDIFYEDWRMKIAENPRLFRATSQLWRSSYCHNGETQEELPQEDAFKWHPYGPFDCDKGFMYVDRVGYRLPTALAEKLGNHLEQEGNVTSSSRKKKKKSKAIQRSLTPHLDCCPETIFSESSSKWRPIQCFVSLTTNLEPNTGGFEAAPGFHREFQNWSANRPCSVFSKKLNGIVQETVVPAPCLGEYTHIRPKDDAEIMKRVRHIPVRAGSVVFWDNRIPHANAYRNDGDYPRAVVYCSFLPDVAVNDKYVKNQLMKYRRQINPTDQWIRPSEGEGENSEESHNGIRNDRKLSKLARKLLGLDKW